MKPITLDRNKNKELNEFFEIIEFYMRRFETINRYDKEKNSNGTKFGLILSSILNRIRGNKIVGIDYDSPNVKTTIKDQVVIELDEDKIIFKIIVKVSNPNSNSEGEFPFTLSSNGEIDDYDKMEVEGTLPIVGLYWSLIEHLIDHQKEFSNIYDYFKSEIIPEIDIFQKSNSDDFESKEFKVITDMLEKSSMYELTEECWRRTISYSHDFLSFKRDEDNSIEIIMTFKELIYDKVEIEFTIAFDLHEDGSIKALIDESINVSSLFYLVKIDFEILFKKKSNVKSLQTYLYGRCVYEERESTIDQMLNE